MVERFCAQLDEKADAGEVVDAIYAFGQKRALFNKQARLGAFISYMAL